MQYDVCTGKHAADEMLTYDSNMSNKKLSTVIKMGLLVNAINKKCKIHFNTSYY